MSWYYKVTSNLDLIPEFIEYYETELIQARYELSLKGKSIEQHAGELPGLVEYRFSQLQEIEAILEFLNISLRKQRSAQFKKFTENYNKTLSSSDVVKYIDGVDEIVDATMLVNEVALLRNKYLGITKGQETKNFMIAHISRLKVAGLDDATVS